MNDKAFKWSIGLLGGVFALLFVAICVPPLLRHPDIIGAALAGFVNPFSSGYALDAIFCWCVLAVWVLHERKQLNLRHGWMALALGVVPGVATGFAFYLLLRQRHLRRAE